MRNKLIEKITNLAHPSFIYLSVYVDHFLKQLF